MIIIKELETELVISTITITGGLQTLTITPMIEIVIMTILTMRVALITLTSHGQYE